MKIELNHFKYATKAELKGETVVDTSKLAAKKDLAILKTQTDRLGLDKIEIVPVD